MIYKVVSEGWCTHNMMLDNILNNLPDEPKQKIFMYYYHESCESTIFSISGLRDCLEFLGYPEDQITIWILPWVMSGEEDKYDGI